MKRRSRVGGEGIKGRRKAREPKRQALFTSPPTQEETEVARLTRELKQALEQQAATSEVLGVINSSTGELERVLPLNAGERHPYLRRQVWQYLPPRWAGPAPCGDT